MAESMVERVARAIQSADFEMSRKAVRGEDTGDEYTVLARAAIEAMREPTREMDDAGRDNNFMRYATPAWQAMIDAALNEQVAG